LPSREDPMLTATVPARTHAGVSGMPNPPEGRTGVSGCRGWSW
jgi:hypothetical protein